MLQQLDSSNANKIWTIIFQQVAIISQHLTWIGLEKRLNNVALKKIDSHNHERPCQSIFQRDCGHGMKSKSKLIGWSKSKATVVFAPFGNSHSICPETRN